HPRGPVADAPTSYRDQFFTDVVEANNLGTEFLFVVTDHGIAQSRPPLKYKPPADPYRHAGGSTYGKKLLREGLFPGIFGKAAGVLQAGLLVVARDDFQRLRHWFFDH